MRQEERQALLHVSLSQFFGQGFLIYIYIYILLPKIIIFCSLLAGGNWSSCNFCLCGDNF